MQLVPFKPFGREIDTFEKEMENLSKKPKKKKLKLRLNKHEPPFPDN
jgi:hypothetical protein